MAFRVLGTLELVPGALPSAPQRAPGGAPVLSRGLRRLLAALLVRADSVVAVDALADVVWGEDPPVNVEAATHNLISRLRSALRAAAVPVPAEGPMPGNGATVLLTRAPGYLLQVAPGELDSARFEQLATAGRACRADEPARAAALLDEAIALWRGPAYAEYADEDFARPTAVRLEQALVTAREDRVDAALALGRHEDAVGRLEPLLAEHPLRERLHAQMMLALYRAGRQADALATYRRFHDHLDGELGLVPSAELTALQTKILRQDEALRWRPPASLAAAAPTTDPAPPGPVPSPDPVGRPGATPGNLPARAPDLLGRQEAAAQIAAALIGAAVLTLTGPGGIGKTSLALRVAADATAARDRGEPNAYRDGVWLVELASVSDPVAVIDAVTTVLSVRQGQDLSALERLVGFLRPKGLLLVLDNCEHVIDAVAALVDTLARRCRDVTILATSREPLGIEAERVVPVPPLPVPSRGAEDLATVIHAPSVALFSMRAAAVAPRFALTPGNAAAVAEICRRLDGVPLAIELAAARMPSMTPAEVVERLSSRFHLLRSSRRIAAERHRTLRAVVDWSYELLDPAERHVFDRLAVFAGAFSLAAAEAVAGDEAGDVGDVLGRLVDRSLVLAAAGADGATRYTLLETMRAYGQERLAERDQLDTVRRRHALCGVALTEQAAPQLLGAQSLRWAETITAALDDLRSAHAWALDHDLELAQRLVAALADYAEARMVPEVFSWAERTARAAPAGSALLPVVCSIAASGARFRGDLAGAGRWVQQGLASAAEPEDPVRRYPLLIHCEVLLFQGRLEEVRAQAAEVERLAALAGDPHRESMAALDCALALAYSGEPAQAKDLAERTREEAEHTDRPLDAAWARYAEGEAMLDLDPDRAIVALEDALRRARALGDHFLTGVALVSAASVRSRHGDPRQALLLFSEVVRHWQQAGNRTQQWTTIRSVVGLLARVGAAEDAAVLLGVLTSRSTGAPVFGADGQRLEQTARQLQDRLGPAGLAAASAVGSAMSDEEVPTWAWEALDRALV